MEENIRSLLAQDFLELDGREWGDFRQVFTCNGGEREGFCFRRGK